jgi:Tfp pilus assembly protein PilE
MSKAAECQKKVQPAGEAETTKKQENLKESPMSKVSTPLFRKRRGVTFIELIGVLVVAIIIIAGALALYSEANTSSRTNQLLVAVGALTGSVRALHANTANYGGGLDASDSSIDTTLSLVTVLVNANAVPPGLLILQDNVAAVPATATTPGTPASTTTTINHAFGGRVDVFGFGQLFAISAESLDQDICIRVSTESTAKASSGLRGVYVGNKATGRNATRDAASLVTQVSETVDQKDGGDVSAGEGIFVTTSTTGVTTGKGFLPISPTLADTSCENSTDNRIVWVFQ